MKTLRTLLLCALGLLSVVTASATDFYVRGVARCILDDGSGLFPISEAGEVFVSNSPSVVPVWNAGEYSSATVSLGSASANFFFWARAKAGYSFVGWASTKSSTSPTAGTEGLEGQPWESKTTLWSAKTEAEPNEFVRYAIFRKNAAEDTSGGGVPALSVEGASYTEGSSLNDWPVKINFAEPLAFKDANSYAKGYGVNTSLIWAITCHNVETGEDLRVKTALVQGATTVNVENPIVLGSDAHGVVFIPASITAGSYRVHLPKGLFTTASGKPTAAYDFNLQVLPDMEPFHATSTSPEEGYAWDASVATQSKETDGNFSTIGITFNKNIASVNTEGKEFVLTNTTTGRVSKASRCSISATTNKRLGVVIFDYQPNGEYTFTLPPNVFYDAAGKGNEPMTLHFSISGSSVKTWELPNYSSWTASPANYATVEELREVDFTFSRAGYAPPRTLYSNTKATATKITEVYKDDVDYSSPENLPELQSENIDGVTLALEGGVLKVRFANPVAEATKVVVTIPASTVINVPIVRGMTDQQLYEKGGCTNAAVQITINVKPDPNKSATAGTVAHTIDDAQHGRATLSDVNTVVSKVLKR